MHLVDNSFTLKNSLALALDQSNFSVDWLPRRYLIFPSSRDRFSRRTIPFDTRFRRVFMSRRINHLRGMFERVTEFPSAIPGTAGGVAIPISVND